MPVAASRSPCPVPLGRERRLPGGGEPQQEAERGHEEHGGLGGQGLQAAHVHLLLDQAVRGEGERQHQRDPGRPAVSDRQDEDGRQARGDGDPLDGPQPFTQQQDAHGDGDQRIDEVAERRLDDLAVVHGPDVEAPVDRDRRRRDRYQGELAPVADQFADPRPAAYGQERDGDDAQGPDHPVGQDLDRPGRFEQRPEQGDQAPHHVRADSVQQPCPLFVLPLHRVPSLAARPRRPIRRRHDGSAGRVSVS